MFVIHADKVMTCEFSAPANFSATLIPISGAQIASLFDGIL